MKSTIHIGTSGWTYDDWRPLFYPEKLPKKSWLEFYATQFDCVEINATFYRFFKDNVYQNWHDRVPPNFLFMLKVPRLITHKQQLNDPDNIIEKFCQSAALLKNKLGMILLQLSPTTKINLNKLKEVVKHFPDPEKLVIEFRNDTWLTEETRLLLTELGCTFCIVDSPKNKPLLWLTNSTAYIRFHGREKWFDYNYTHAELDEFAEMIKNLEQRGAKTIYVMFNNAYHTNAIKNAVYLRDRLT